MSDLTIRAPIPEDIDALTEMANMPGVRFGTMRVPYTSRAFTEKRIAPQEGKHVLIAVREGKPVGQGVLLQFRGRRAHAGELYLFVHDDHVGTGIGTALMRAMLDLADRWIGLRRVELTVNADNEPAIKLYERMGFEHEGTRRADVLRGGRLVDCHMMARLRDAPA